MKIKICIAYILVLIVMGTLCSCGTSTNKTESLFDELDVDYTANDDGTYTYKGNIYKYKSEVSGIEGESPVTFIVLTNDTETSFEDISYSLKKAEISTGIPEFVVLGWHSLTPEHGDTEEAETQIRLDEDFQRIESYTQKYFSDLNAIEFSEEGFDTFYWKAFSSIVETEESETWRDQPVTDLNSPVP